jgi:hypothetical protein
MRLSRLPAGSGPLDVPSEHYTESNLGRILLEIDRYSRLGAGEAFAAGKRATVVGSVSRLFDFFAGLPFAFRYPRWGTGLDAGDDGRDKQVFQICKIGGTLPTGGCSKPHQVTIGDPVAKGEPIAAIASAMDCGGLG